MAHLTPMAEQTSPRSLALVRLGDVLDELVKRLGRRAGIPADLQRAHVLRHTMATRWAARPGANLEVLRRQLGHADLKTTQIYMQPDDELDEREVLAFDAGAIALERDAASN